jgi:hypothetical protein
MPALGYPRQKSWSPECLVYSGFIAITIYFISLQAHMSQYFIKQDFILCKFHCLFSFQKFVSNQITFCKNNNIFVEFIIKICLYIVYTRILRGVLKVSINKLKCQCDEETKKGNQIPVKCEYTI